jgi:hypothetical protein
MKVAVFMGSPAEWLAIGGTQGLITEADEPAAAPTDLALAGLTATAHIAADVGVDHQEIKPWLSDTYEQNRRYGKDREFQKRAAFRRAFTPGQIAFFRLMLAKTDVDGTPNASRPMLCEALGKTPAQFNGILGPLGHRVTATPHEQGVTLGIGSLLTYDIIDGVWHYGLQPTFRALLVEYFAEHPDTD